MMEMNVLNINLQQNADKIKKIEAKRITIKIEKLEGFDCTTRCENDYIEIKYLKDKTATGARICCKFDRLLTINSEDDTEVLIMKRGNMGEYDISYQKELAPSQESSNCKEVRKSIWDPNNLQTRGELYVLDEKGNFALGPDGKWIVKQYFGPNFCLRCHRKNAMIINGKYFRRNDCVEDNDPDPDCSYSTCFYCKTVEGSMDANWYWQNPEGEWILVNLMDCYPKDGLN
uniref:Uncharacterized protein n=1 Tax=Meloidogyne enterolobii TaxID=390850 RepID=A0A6V7WNT1_MELEN|nr:unnamed protein product [Meloidogyne enterolobii]